MKQNPWKTIQEKYFPFARNKKWLQKNLSIFESILEWKFGSNFRDLKEKLIGYLESPPEIVEEKLKEKKFSSLFSPYEDQVSIMFGFFSLVNHQCNSHTYFSVKPYGSFYKSLLKINLGRWNCLSSWRRSDSNL